MAQSLQSFDVSFPTFTGEETQKQKIDAIYDYLNQMRTGLKFALGALNTSVNKLKKLPAGSTAGVAELQKTVEELEGRITVLEQALLEGGTTQ